MAASDREKRMGFVLAALNGKADALRRMIDLGADVKSPSEDLYSHGRPLHHAVCSGSWDAVKVLVEAGANLGTNDTAWQGTPLGWAAHYQGEAKDDATRGRYARIAEYLRARCPHSPA
jgi:Ankyrin repeats (3 copies)